MSHVNTAVLMRDSRQFDDLVSLSKACRNVLQGSREPERAILHRIGDQLLHLFQLGNSGWPIVIADNVLADLRRTDEGAEVDARALLFQTIEVFAQRAPIYGQVETAVEIFRLFDLPFINRGD